MTCLVIQVVTSSLVELVRCSKAVHSLKITSKEMQSKCLIQDSAYSCAVYIPGRSFWGGEGTVEKHFKKGQVLQANFLQKFFFLSLFSLLALANQLLGKQYRYIADSYKARKFKCNTAITVKESLHYSLEFVCVKNQTQSW